MKYYRVLVNFESESGLKDTDEVIPAYEAEVSLSKDSEGYFELDSIEISDENSSLVSNKRFTQEELGAIEEKAICLAASDEENYRLWEENYDYFDDL